MEIHEPFNPLNKKNLGLSVADAMLEKPIEPLPPQNAFKGAGIYAIYYTGDFPAYKRIAELNKNKKFTCPIYVGKAVPAGARKGGFGLDAPAKFFISDFVNTQNQSRKLKILSLPISIAVI